MAKQTLKPRILVTGPIFNTPSGPSGQGGKLFSNLKKEGYTVYKRSFYRNRLMRLIDTLSFIILHRSRYDLIIVQLFSYRAFILEDIVVSLGNLLGKKTIAVIRGGAFPEFYKQFPNWSGRVLANCHRVETPSLFIQQYLNGKGIRVNHTPNFIDTSYFPFNWENPAQPTLLWVRAFHDIYKPELAIRCVHYLKQKYPGIKLTMIGPDQGKLAYCRQLMNELGVQNNIDVLGVIPNHELNSYYKSHMVFITTTSYESFGVALVEAACSGIPMVSTSAGEIPYMWKDGEEMLIADDNNQDMFNQKVEELLTNQNLRNLLSVNAFKKAKTYTWEHVKSRWDEIIAN